MKSRALPLIAGLMLLIGARHAAFSPAADAGKAAAPRQVPYRLTETQHILVRAKINGKGPYNFILDTGAPALFVSTALARKLKIEPDKQGWGTFECFELEGGVMVERIKGHIADPYQLEGMNQLGLAGAELHGVIGYNLLARYRIEIDLTRDKMTWTRLEHDPPLPEGLNKKGAANLESLGGLVKLAAGLLGKKEFPKPQPRGFLGIELVDVHDAVSIQAVLEGSPAAKADLKAGDRLTHFQTQPVQSSADVLQRAALLAAGETVRLTILRGKETRQVTVQLGKGL